MDINERDFPNKNEILALLLAFLPFICNFSETTRETVNGRVVNESTIDYADIILGALAVLAGLALARLFPTYSADTRLKHTGIFLLVIAVGIFQVVRGAGML